MTAIIGVKLAHKEENSAQFQQILTDYNCYVKTRLGINSTSVFCSDFGIILLHIEDNKIAEKIEMELIEIEGIEIQRMIFN